MSLVAYQAQLLGSAQMAFEYTPPEGKPPVVLDQRDLLWHYHVAPKKKLVWCSIWKAMSMQIDALFHRIHGDPDWRQFSWGNFTRSCMSYVDYLHVVCAVLYVVSRQHAQAACQYMHSAHACDMHATSMRHACDMHATCMRHASMGQLRGASG